MTSSHPVAPPIDVELAPALAAHRRITPWIGIDTLDEIRAQAAANAKIAEPPDLTAGGLVEIRSEMVQSMDGAAISLLIARPARRGHALPLLYNTHAGGMVLGDARSELNSYIRYVAEGLAVAIGVDYRLAPEHPDPTPIEDCYAGLKWAAEHVEELGVDPNRLILVGSSAGGGLAAGLALLARDRGFPAIALQILRCPMLDDRFQTASSQMLDGTGSWDRNENRFGWSSLLGDRIGGPDVSSYAAPARAVDLSGLPKTFIDVGSVDSFRDEALDYARRLSAAGVVVDFHMYGGAFHGSEGLVPQAAVSRASASVMDDYIRRALHAPG